MVYDYGNTVKRHIILIEDEKEVGESLSMFLNAKGFFVSHFLTAEEFFSSGPAAVGGIYLVDWNLPGIKGPELIRTLRLRDKLSPIYMISANGKGQDVVEGLRAGADEYLVKPFDFDALAARMENAWAKHSLLEDQLISRGVKLIPEAHSVIKDGTTVSLTAREYVILETLYRAGSVVSREALIKQFEGKEAMTMRNIDVHVFALRKKIAKIDMLIESVRGVGYQLVTQKAG